MRFLQHIQMSAEIVDREDVNDKWQTTSDDFLSIGKNPKLIAELSRRVRYILKNEQVESRTSSEKKSVENSIRGGEKVCAAFFPLNEALKALQRNSNSFNIQSRGSEKIISILNSQ